MTEPPSVRTSPARAQRPSRRRTTAPGDDGLTTAEREAEGRAYVERIAAMEKKVDPVAFHEKITRVSRLPG